MPTPNSFLWATALPKKETTFGGGFATDAVYVDWVPGLSAAFAQEEWAYSDNNDEINGSVGAPTEMILEMKQASLEREFIASTEVVTAMLAWALGVVTSSGAADPWTHTIKFPDPCNIQPPSTSFVELLNCAGASGTNWKYKGVTINTLALELSSKGYIKLTVGFKTDGSETAAISFTAPTATITRRSLLGNQATILYGVAGTEPQANIRNFKFSLDLGLVVPPDISASILVPQWQYGAGKPSIEVEFTLAGDKSHAIYTLAQASTPAILNVTIDPGVTPARSVKLTCSKTICTATVKPSGNENQITVKVMPWANATDGTATNPKPAVFVCKTGQATYLTAA